MNLYTRMQGEWEGQKNHTALLETELIKETNGIRRR